MADADKVRQGLSASDIIVKQCRCKPLSVRQWIGAESDMLFRQLVSPIDKHYCVQ
jgi:hypothetical protein